MIIIVGEIALQRQIIEIDKQITILIIILYVNAINALNNK